jgi:sterol desaturase/sphingolipid hydroxylase (fatty acid hydroxylase superfamily)
MFSIVIVSLFGLILGDGLGYFIHMFLHSPRSGQAFRAHMNHHLKQYPTTSYLSEKYRSPGKDNTVFIFGAVLLVLCSLMFIFLPLRFAIILSAEFLVLGLLNDYLHDRFHIHPHWLEKYKFFHKLRATHYLHHRDMKTNYGIFSFIFDRMCGTYNKIKTND